MDKTQNRMVNGPVVTPATILRTPAEIARLAMRVASLRAEAAAIAEHPFAEDLGRADAIADELNALGFSR